MTASFEEVRKRSYDVLGKIQEKLRSDWLYEDHGPSHDQVEALKEASRHIAAAKAALAKAGGPAISSPAAKPMAPAASRFSIRRR